ncbi:hypothetical protein QW131_17105 [Roseibium salinum]|nr:hypothetical protein [Roseibium salinum]
MATKTTESKAEQPEEPATEDVGVDTDADFTLNRELTADNLIKDYVIASVAASIVPVAFFSTSPPSSQSSCG